LRDWHVLPFPWTSMSFVLLFFKELLRYLLAVILRCFVWVLQDIVPDTLHSSGSVLPDSRVLRFYVKFLLHFRVNWLFGQWRVRFNRLWGQHLIKIWQDLQLFGYKSLSVPYRSVSPSRVLTLFVTEYLHFRKHLLKFKLLAPASCPDRDTSLVPIMQPISTVCSRIRQILPYMIQLIRLLSGKSNRQLWNRLDLHS